jgi:hypothetical protein
VHPSQVAEMIAQNSQTGKTASAQVNAVWSFPWKKRKPSANALNAIGYGMPQV